MSETIYLPATDTLPATAAPPLLTEDEVLRLLRIESKDGYQAIRRMREQPDGLLGFKVGTKMRFMLSDVMQFLQVQRQKAIPFAPNVASKENESAGAR